MAPPREGPGKVEARHIEETDDYEIGAEVDGVWVSFARIAGEQVRTNVANHKEADGSAAEEQS